ncbi:efflux RND transporter permease subunit [Spongiibacter sp. KMU-158]|uniref:Efflux RND transporter permease subunit n=1 Tax=Spongiibacter pelagi TaxID=2760804 RepID=A0A927BYC5_9GAMM|nr:efflux RND transporter permease subunit [Spongiibacter pelagi]MBD2857818.1 efflux RND transporter permease subunit [Spongiibacter pelagi]
MLLSDISVKRPVFAAVISMLLLAFGLLSFERLPLREYPDIDPPIVSITTTYTGASAEVVESRITQLIEDRIAGIEGIKTVTSTSRDGVSAISIEFELSRDIDAAANDVRDRVARISANLPEEADPPEVQKTDSDERVIMWLNLTSTELNPLELADYANRYVVDRFSVIDGVARVLVSGASDYAMRIWLDRQAMAAHKITTTDVQNALTRENLELPAGNLKSRNRDFIVKLPRQYHSVDDFEQLVIRRENNGYLLRLGDIARIEFGASESRALFRGNGVPQVGIGIIKQSVANTLSVGEGVRREAELLRPSLPSGTELHPSYDTTVFIDSAIKEVYSTLFISAALVVLVIFLFLGDFRAMLVPALTVPVSLIATFTVLYALGYTLNLLTLLALVLAIGLVVDDSIVVLENIHRRLQQGESPLVAAYRGSRQVGFAVIATTLVLVAVFVPITFIEGDLGRLFGEFAVAMSVAVLFSSLVALTLSPMICSKLLSQQSLHSGLADFVERLLNKLENRYRTLLDGSMKKPLLSGSALLLAIIASVMLFQQIPGEFAPKEDRGVIIVMLRGPEGASFDYTVDHLMEFEQRLMPLAEQGEFKRFLIRSPNSWAGGDAYNMGTSILVLEDWNQRRSSDAIIADIRNRLKDFTGMTVIPIQPQSLGGGFSQPIEFVIGGGSYIQLAKWRDQIMSEARNNPGLLRVNDDYKETQPQFIVNVDRNRAADLGVSNQEINRSLQTLLGSRRVTTFMFDGEEYDVILEGEREAHSAPTDLANIYVRSDTTQALIPLSNLVRFSERGDASVLSRYNKVRAITISANLAEGYSQGEALDYLENITREIAPQATIDYKGQSLKYKETGSSIYFTFAMALLIVFLVLAAQFESFIHPLVILLTVPLAIAGALFGLYICGQSLNIFSQIALIMLVGLAAKNGILMVEFTNQLRDQGVDFEEAITRAAQLRLRPILMTAITTIMGAVPLLLSFGAGSESRYVIGVVIFFGVSAATLFTLFVIPMAYRLLAKHTGSPLDVTHRLDKELASQPDQEA